MGPRADYDLIAERYDDEPLRAKPVDPDLLAFLEAPRAPDPSALTVLDVGCGTGNQLLADRARFGEAFLVGVDPFTGMLRRARGKSAEVRWVRGEGVRLPFADGSFHYVTSQFAFHHVVDKAGMIAEVSRVLMPGGRFVMVNISPPDMKDWLIYRYFPAAWKRDESDFLASTGIVALLAGAGFLEIESEKTPLLFEQDLRDFAETARERTVSQFLAISDREYMEGLEKIEREILDAGDRPLPTSNPSCLVKIRGDKGRD